MIHHNGWYYIYIHTFIFIWFSIWVITLMVSMDIIQYDSYIIWLVVSNMFYFPYGIILPIVSYVSRWLKPPTSNGLYIIVIWIITITLMIYPWISSSIIVIIYTVYVIYTSLEWNIRWDTRIMLFIYIVVYQWSGHIIHYIMIMENMDDTP